MIAIVAGLVLGLWWLRSAMARVGIRSIVNARRDSDLPTLIRDTTRRIRGDVHTGVRELVRTLVVIGRVGETVRIAPSQMADSVDPVRVPFEPQLLEHVEAGSGMAAPAAPKANSLGAYLGRNLGLKGGAILATIFGLNIVMAGIGSFLRREISASLLMWSAMLAALLFLPVRLRSSRGHWLLVPGGLAFRNTRRRRDWSLHVFDRARSVLCVYRSTKNGWGFAVADAGHCESAIATRGEIQAVLRAWLSPLAPPTVEQMTDWG